MILAKKYNLINKIPYNSYIRKLVGYLFAIDNGAKYIYETDDDNSPLDGLFGFRYENFKGLELDLDNECNNDTLFVNPYSYFGQPSVWPRGYPLEKITDTSSYRPINSESKNCISKLYKIYDNKRVPLIQQGLVNGDPDVDAIYRLTRKNENLLNIKFDVNSPPFVLSNKHQYAPLNSQNTFYHYDSFFTLIFPLNVTFRECDILRGYISIRLLQEINGRVAFMPPNALQIRNSHSFHKDYLEEKRLYESIYKFVDDLDKWTCEKDTLKECVIDCIQMLINNKHFESSELDFYKTWLNDLESIGYKWPKLNRNNQQSKTKTDLLSIYHKSIEQEHSSISNQNEMSSKMINSNLNQINNLISICQFKISLNSKICKFDNFVLITAASSIEELHKIDTFTNVHFPYIVVCFNKELDNDVKNYLASNFTSSFTIIFNSKNSFKYCIKKAFQIGLKQQSFVISMSLKNFNFWNDKLQLIDPNAQNKIDFNDLESENLEQLNSNIYFLRRNVANALKIIKAETKESLVDSYCLVLRMNDENAVCNFLKTQIESLNWHSNDLASECENIDASTVWIPDYHDGPRIDLSSTLANLGQKPILAGYKRDSTPFPEALQSIKISLQLSSVVSSPNPYLTESAMKTNYEYYKTSSDFKDVDFVICSFPASLCEPFIPLNKSIIFNPAHRYNLARCSIEKWEKQNKNYYMLRSKNKLVLSSMSKYDAEYQAHFTGLYGYRLYGYGGFYAKGVKYNPKRTEILVGPTNQLGRIGGTVLIELNNYAKAHNYTFAHVRTLYSRYTLHQLANHRAIVLFPYSVMAYSIIDFYISRIPIFLPSIKLLTEWKNVNDRTIREPFYCNKVADITPANNTIHKFSPNDDIDEAYSYWLQYADYFQWPFVTTFESWKDLINKLKTLDLKKISDSMTDFNKIREADLLNNWCKILKTKDKTATIPKSYEEALKYFNTDKFQALN